MNVSKYQTRYFMFSCNLLAFIATWGKNCYSSKLPSHLNSLVCGLLAELLILWNSFFKVGFSFQLKEFIWKKYSFRILYFLFYQIEFNSNNRNQQLLYVLSWASQIFLSKWTQKTLHFYFTVFLHSESFKLFFFFPFYCMGT